MNCGFRNKKDFEDPILRLRVIPRGVPMSYYRSVKVWRLKLSFTDTVPLPSTHTDMKKHRKMVVKHFGEVSRIGTWRFTSISNPDFTGWIVVYPITPSSRHLVYWINKYYIGTFQTWPSVALNSTLNLRSIAFGASSPRRSIK